MSAHSHPSPLLLRRFAAGDLAIAPALVVECHLETCRACADAVSRAETEHGHALSRLPNAPLRPDALARALDQLDVDAAPERPFLGDVALTDALVRQGFHARRFLGPDYWVAPVRRTRQDGWRAYLLRAPAGTGIPAHRHLGQEYFQVLMGTVTDGERREAGDFVSGAPGDDHALQVTTDGPCACLIAAEHGAQWRGITRLLSPWLGI
ncbi:cupin domain-containing protein [Caulobacter sp.]|uniref:cupin domain-containing protein n=1 Tax=Caulobacter sp. TaxID=78 RepID=UPI001B1A77E9|nr:cupin domain-containing protein [Caulobacter sp.]MBO9547161.1 cupin domain-containing protein [Caulobacter sp.]